MRRHVFFLAMLCATEYNAAPLRHHGDSKPGSQKHQQEQQHKPAGLGYGAVQPLIDGIAAEAHYGGNLVGMVAIEVQTHKPLVVGREEGHQMLYFLLLLRRIVVGEGFLHQGSQRQQGELLATSQQVER